MKKAQNPKTFLRRQKNISQDNLPVGKSHSIAPSMTDKLKNPPPDSAIQNTLEDDLKFFQQAMRDVKPLANCEAPERLPRLPAKKTTIKHKNQLSRQIREYFSDEKLIDPLSEHLPPAHLTGEAHICHLPTSLTRRQQRALQRGTLPIEARLDLHGHTLVQARGELFRFIQACYANERRCVLIIHGKGREPSGLAKLKSAVVYWLQEIPEVLAWCSAPSADGGTGALRVLLRAQKT